MCWREVGRPGLGTGREEKNQGDKTARSRQGGSVLGGEQVGPTADERKAQAAIKLGNRLGWALSRDTRSWSPSEIPSALEPTGSFSNNHHVGRGEGGLHECWENPELPGASCPTAQRGILRLHCRHCRIRECPTPCAFCLSPLGLPPSHSPPGVQRPTAALRLFLVLPPGRKIGLGSCN